ncbi:MAG: cytochrome c [Sphingomonadales bacterium]
MTATVLATVLSVGQPARGEEDATVRLYNTYCTQCHGIERNGKGVNTVGLSVQPRDHSDKVGMSSIPIEELTKAITEGGASVNKSALMPAWGGVLTTEQIADLVVYLRKICHCDEK